MKTAKGQRTYTKVKLKLRIADWQVSSFLNGNSTLFIESFHLRIACLRLYCNHLIHLIGSWVAHERISWAAQSLSCWRHLVLWLHEVVCIHWKDVLWFEVKTFMNLLMSWWLEIGTSQWHTVIAWHILLITLCYIRTVLEMTLYIWILTDFCAGLFWI